MAHLALKAKPDCQDFREAKAIKANQVRTVALDLLGCLVPKVLTDFRVFPEAREIWVSKVNQDPTDRSELREMVAGLAWMDDPEVQVCLRL